jgi:hypothetical protein
VPLSDLSTAPAPVEVPEHPQLALAATPAEGDPFRIKHPPRTFQVLLR